jgi:hypothetical protein
MMIGGGSLDFFLYMLCTNKCHTELKQHPKKIEEKEKQHIVPKITLVTVIMVDDKTIKTTVNRLS